MLAERKCKQIISPDPTNKFVDIRLAKRWSFGTRSRLEARFDLFNLLNANHSIWEVDTLGSRWKVPSRILAPRIIRFGVLFSF